MTPWLSILIPAYKVADYLNECLASIMPQLDSGCEVLLLDDASPDNCYAIMQHWLQQYPGQLRVFRHEHNQGLSAARNTLLQHACGDYLWFFDSDDVMTSGAIGQLKSILTTHAPDLVLCDFELLRSKRSLKHYLRGEHHRSSFHGIKQQLCTDKEALIAGLFAAGQMHIWSKVSRRSLWQQGLLFPVGRYFEDIHVSPKLALNAASYYYQPATWVKYRQRAGSILSNKTPAMQQKKATDLAEALLGFESSLQQILPHRQARTNFYISYFCSRNFIGACKATTASQEAPNQQLQQNLAALKASIAMPLPALLLACCRQGWLVRALKLGYWLHKAQGSARNTAWQH
ncbi:glycosyltransferase family 2 protein [Alkalimonas amylolytica]|uniref:Glycosyl transferase family 2 n=1 Tax=Alkalimonas amylolytica TaxID=152573 RepID=A0A1H3YCD8_ALKAM|nr:glycosyltransferase family 2 protein [Alkalimonas amylolytica]SEA08612.1 Glycosyl transferase family 2 [Alkalimonas amylolytica]